MKALKVLKEVTRETLEFLEGEHREDDEAAVPLFERAAPPAFALHWAMPLPGAVGSVGAPGLVAVLRSQGVALLQADVLALEALSALLGRLRASCLQTRCDPDALLLYGALLRRLSAWFYNTSVPQFCSYWTSDAQPGASLLGEYAQVLLLTALRLYNDVVTRRAWDRSAGDALARARLALEELAWLCDEEACPHGRWFYAQSPSSLSSQAVQQQTQHPQQADWAQLRAFLLTLGGAEQVRARLSLLEAKANEVRCAILEDAAQAEEQAGADDLAHQRLAPLMTRVSQQYEALGARPGHSLRLYAEFMALHWAVRAGLTLVESEYAARADSIVLGKSALRRLEDLIRVVDARRLRWVAALTLDPALRASFDQAVARVRALYDELQPAMLNYGYNAALVVLAPTPAYTEPTRAQGDYAALADARLDAEPQVAQALRRLAELWETAGAVVVTEARVPQPGDAHLCGQLEERERCYAWLWEGRQADGTILLDAGTATSIGAELTRVRHSLAHNRRLLQQQQK